MLLAFGCVLSWYWVSYLQRLFVFVLANELLHIYYIYIYIYIFNLAWKLLHCITVCVPNIWVCIMKITNPWKTCPITSHDIQIMSSKIGFRNLGHVIYPLFLIFESMNLRSCDISRGIFNKVPSRARVLGFRPFSILKAVQLLISLIVCDHYSDGVVLSGFTLTIAFHQYLRISMKSILNVAM